MHLGQSCPGTNEHFRDGITNGAQWCVELIIHKNFHSISNISAQGMLFMVECKIGIISIQTTSK